MIMSMNTCRWNGLALGIIFAVMVHLAAANNAGRVDEPWPMLLSSEPASIDPSVVLLHQRANGSLEKLQWARASEQPL
jgi:hypothetical protein